MVQKEKEQALDMAVKQIQRQFGEGSIMRLGKSSLEIVEDSISTGAISLDLALGVGGVPRGRIVEVYGPEASGKTTITLHMIAEAQKKDGIAAFIDAEHALDPAYASNLGVNIDNLLISQPDTGEQALEICEALVRSSAVDIIVIDSVAALVPKAEIEGEMGDTHVGLQARLMSQAMRKLAGSIHKSKTLCVFINQIREKVGVMFGNPETTTGGRALKFYSSIRMEIRRTQALKDGDEIVGNRTKVKVVKNKVAPPFRTAEFDILYGKGISSASSLLDVAVNFDIVQRAGSWYSYGDDLRLGQGRENAREFLDENKELMEEILDKVREKAGLRKNVKESKTQDENSTVVDKKGEGTKRKEKK